MAFSGFSNSHSRKDILVKRIGSRDRRLMYWRNTTRQVIGPTCHYDVIDFVFVAKRRDDVTDVFYVLPSGAKTSLIEFVAERRDDVIDFYVCCHAAR